MSVPAGETASINVPKAAIAKEKIGMLNPVGNDVNAPKNVRVAVTATIPTKKNPRDPSMLLVDPAILYL